MKRASITITAGERSITLAQARRAMRRAMSARKNRKLAAEAPGSAFWERMLGHFGAAAAPPPKPSKPAAKRSSPRTSKPDAVKVGARAGKVARKQLSRVTKRSA
mgnify:CR=1 FL=1